MAREYDYVVSELQRVSRLLGLDPQDPAFTRTVFLSFVPDTTEDVPTNVTKHDLFLHGGFSRIKKDASIQLGHASPQRNPAVRGSAARVLYTRKLERELATRDYFLKELRRTIRSSLTVNPIELPERTQPKASTRKTRTLRTVLLSDLHFGVFVSPHDVLGSSYTWEVAARRLAKVCLAATEDPDVDLRIVLAGDIVHGVIHLSESNLRPITEQLCGASQLLTSAIGYMSSTVHGKTSVVCVPGNHDRMVYKSTNRALSQRWDSYASLLYITLKAAFSSTDIKFTIPASGIALDPHPSGGLMLVAHGDVEPTSGNVGSSINTRELKNKLIKLRETQDIPKTIEVALFGHWHTPTMQMLADGTYVIVNGSLIGADPYSQNALGIYNATPAQVMFESTRTTIVRNFNVVQVRSADRDSSLSDIVPTPVIIDPDGNIQ